jgi:hypothetical protein
MIYPGFTLDPDNEDQKGKHRIHIRKFTAEEDAQLKILVTQYGSTDWEWIARLMSGRNGRQCRERWNNYIDPALNTNLWTLGEDLILTQKYEELGPQWRKIASSLPGRSRNRIKNRWIFLEKKKQDARPSVERDSTDFEELSFSDDSDTDPGELFLEGDRKKYVRFLALVPTKRRIR